MSHKIARRSRRRFLQESGAGLAGTVAWGPRVRAASLPVPPPHRQQAVEGVHAYVRQESVPAGGVVELCASNTVPYRLSFCRLGKSVDDPQGDDVLATFPSHPRNVQPIHPGSYVHVAKGPGRPLSGLTLECWVRPWRTTARAGLVTRHDAPGSCAWGLFLTAEGGISFYLGDGGRYRAEFSHATAGGRLVTGRWHHVAATWDGHAKAVYMDGALAGRWPFEAPRGGSLPPGRAPLRLAAAGEADGASLFLDGDLAAPAVYDRALDEARMRERARTRALEAPVPDGLLAFWDFAEECGATVRDRSGHGCDGRIINHATWMIGGPSFDADVSRFDRYAPGTDARRGHGLRFSSDDLYDCDWQVTRRFRLPATARSGLHVARLAFDLDGKPRVQNVIFVVRSNPRRKKAPVLVLAATNTWRAYSGTPFGLCPEAGQKPVYSTGGPKNSPGSPPAFNLYRAHAAGQGTYQVGLRMPWPAAGPYVLYGGATDYSHLARAERFAHAWLEEAGYAFDVVGDLDLHRDPALLAGYRAVIINGHSEYWSDPMYDGLERYLAGGGNVICLSGNTMFWRVTFDAAGSVMECRKADAPGNQVPLKRRGECWHSHDGARGGLLRECGRPGWRLVGLETLGYNDQSNPAQFGPYLVEAPDHFLFNQPLRVDVKAGEPIGQAPDGRVPRANGHEIDVRLSTLARLNPTVAPAGAVSPEDPPGIVRLANGVIEWKHGGKCFDYFTRDFRPTADQGGELIYWERPEGGRIFNAGSIGAGWALHADPRLQRLLRNVLHHFGVAS